jgi:hypothetical protein
MRAHRDSPTGKGKDCNANLSKLKEVAEWAEQYRVFWTKKLENLEAFPDNDKKKKRSK